MMNANRQAEKLNSVSRLEFVSYSPSLISSGGGSNAQELCQITKAKVAMAHAFMLRDEMTLMTSQGRQQRASLV
jgi:hypothetical protein